MTVQLSNCCKATIDLNPKLDRPECYTCSKCSRVIGSPLNTNTLDENKDTPQSNTDWREEFDRRWPAFSVEGDHSQYSEGLYAPDRENIADFISQLLEAEKKRWKDEGEKVKRQPTQHQIPCPDGQIGCCVFHYEMRLSQEDKQFNAGVDAVLQKLS